MSMAGLMVLPLPVLRGLWAVMSGADGPALPVPALLLSDLCKGGCCCSPGGACEFPKAVLAGSGSSLDRLRLIML